MHHNRKVVINRLVQSMDSLHGNTPRTAEKFLYSVAPLHTASHSGSGATLSAPDAARSAAARASRANAVAPRLESRSPHLPFIFERGRGLERSFSGGDDLERLHAERPVNGVTAVINAE